MKKPDTDSHSELPAPFPRLREPWTVWHKTLEQASRHFRVDGTVAPENGQRIGRYEVIDCVGAGAMGQVYRALDPELQREVAIKVHSLHPGRGGSVHELRARLLREGRALACISDPNVVTVYDVGLFRGQVFVAMELVAGSDLRQWIGAQRRSTKKIVELYLGAAAGLAAAHRVGVIHRDVKPANLVVGNDGRVRVVDFGLARAEASSLNSEAAAQAPLTPLTELGCVMGTPAYISPEQLAGAEVDERCDQFSFCVALWEALTSTLPFAGTTLEERGRAIRNADLQARQRMPRDIRKVLERGLRAAPEQRHESMQVLAERLRRALQRPKRLVLLSLMMAALMASLVTLWSIAASSSRHLHDHKPASTERDANLTRQFQHALKLYMLDRADESLRLLEHLSNDARLAQQPLLACEVLELATAIHIELGHEDRAYQLNTRFLAIARQTKNEDLLLRGLITDLQLRSETRDYEQIRDSMDQARELVASMPGPALDLDLEIAVLEVEIRRGDFKAAKRTLARLRESPDATQNEWQAMLAEADARIALAEGGFARAEQVSIDGLRACDRDGLLPSDLSWSLMTSEATAIYRLGRQGEADELFETSFAAMRAEQSVATSQFLLRFAKERAQQGHAHEASLAIGELRAHHDLRRAELLPALATLEEELGVRELKPKD